MPISGKYIVESSSSTNSKFILSLNESSNFSTDLFSNDFAQFIRMALLLKHVAKKLINRFEQYWYQWIDKSLNNQSYVKSFTGISQESIRNFVHSMGITVAVVINNERPSYTMEKSI